MLDTEDQVQTFTQAREAIETRFANLFDTSICPVEYGNTEMYIKDTSTISAPTKTSKFVRLSMIGGPTFTNEVGRSSTNINGTININIFTSKGIGSNAALEIVDEIYEIFNMKVFNGVNCGFASVLVAPPNNGWYQTNISIPYFWYRCNT